VDSASELVKLYADKFDLLRSGASAQKKPSGSAASQATVKALEELKAVINGHLKVGREGRFGQHNTGITCQVLHAGVSALVLGPA